MTDATDNRAAMSLRISDGLQRLHEERVEKLAQFLNRRIGGDLPLGRMNWRHLKADDKEAWREDAQAVLDFMEHIDDA